MRKLVASFECVGQIELGVMICSENSQEPYFDSYPFNMCLRRGLVQIERTEICKAVSASGLWLRPQGKSGSPTMDDHDTSTEEGCKFLSCSA